MRACGAAIRVGLALLGAAVLCGQQGRVLSAQDYAEIGQLYARYVSAVDSIVDNGAALAGLFTADGVLTDESGKTYTGRDELMAFARTQPGKSPAAARHFVWNVKVDASPRGATGKAYAEVMKLTEPGRPAAVSNLGQYWDDLVKTPEGWHIKSRVFHKAPAPTAPAGVGGNEAVPATGTPVTLPGMGANETGRTVSADPAGSGVPPIRLTAGDYAEILQLYARYPYAFDGGTNEGKASADLYTPDGIFGDARTGKLLRGPEALAANSRGPNKNSLTTAHILTNIMLTPTSDGVVGEAYRISNAGVPVGIYFSLIVKSAEGWRFKETHFTGPNFPLPENAKHFLLKTAKESPSE